MVEDFEERNLWSSIGSSAFLKNSIIFGLPVLTSLTASLLIGFGFPLLEKGGGSLFDNGTKGLKSDSSSSAEVDGSVVVIEISGAVKKPGVFEMRNGERLIRVIEASGGFHEKADLGWAAKNLNSARVLKDGEKIYIPFQGEGGEGTIGDSGTNYDVSAKLDLSTTRIVNVNKASLTELKSLPGIGDVYADLIMKHRPFSDSSDFISRSGLKAAVAEKVLPSIVF